MGDGFFGKLRITSLEDGRDEKDWHSHKGYHGSTETMLVYAQTNGVLVFLTCPELSKYPSRLFRIPEQPDS